MDNEPMPPFLDEDGQELWKMCEWVISGGTASPSTALQIQALAIRRELRNESQLFGLRKINADLLAACMVMRERLTELANRDDCCWQDWVGSYEVDEAIAKATATA